MANEEISRARKLMADAGMVVTAAVGMAVTVHVAPDDLEWLPAVPFAALYALSGFGLTRGSIVTRVLARGAAWSVLAPLLGYALLKTASGGTPYLPAVGAAATTAVALAAAAPALGTRAMRAEFSPTAGRRWFLTGATAASAAGLFTALGALARFTERWGSLGSAMMFAALAAGYLGSVYGLLKMRGWSVLLGGLTGLVLLALSFVDTAYAAPGWIFGSLTLIAGILAPVGLARVGALRHETSGLRVATETGVRIADDLEEEDEEESADGMPARMHRSL